jgi:hypothetical protein
MPGMVMPNGKSAFLELEPRRKLLERALSFKPDLAVGNGDQIYWDQTSWLNNRNELVRNLVRRVYEEVGFFDRAQRVLGTKNEEILMRVCDPQIAQLYGVRFRSVPLYLLPDDHDLFENDEASDQFVTFPPDQFMIDAARSTQHLYYPEFLPDKNRPLGLPGSSSYDRGRGLSEVYGTLRYGNLLECLLYDCRRYMTLKGPTAVFVDPQAEIWLGKRTAAEETEHLIHMPSVPLGWSAGKWGEWYPDVVQKDGRLGTEQPKPYWQKGWWLQHQRLIQMVHGQKKRIPIFVQGDLHAVAWGKIRKSGDLDLKDNPVYALLSGTIGTSDLGWPSAFRGIGANPPSQLVVEEVVKPLEKNSFTIIDVTPQKLKFRLFAWRPPEPVEKISTLEPFHTFEIERRK